MKKILSVILTVLMCATLIACSNSKENKIIYNTALEYENTGDFLKAYDEYLKLPTDYKDVEERIYRIKADNLIYDIAVKYETEGDYLSAYEEYIKLPENYEDVEERLNRIIPIKDCCGYWVYKSHTGTYAPEFYTAEINLRVNDSASSDTYPYIAEITEYDKYGNKDDLNEYSFKIQNNTAILERTIYAATVFGKSYTGTLTRRIEINGNIFTYTYLFDEEILGLYTYEKSDTVGNF